MAKLVYDRPIKVTLSSDQTAAVPEDEVWRGSAYHRGGGSMSASNVYKANPSDTSNILLGGGAQILKATSTLPVSLLSPSDKRSMEGVILHG